VCHKPKHLHKERKPILPLNKGREVSIEQQTQPTFPQTRKHNRNKNRTKENKPTRIRQIEEKKYISTRSSSSTITADFGL
jgi:hypothetical protein